jgi:hypothetical protein
MKAADGGIGLLCESLLAHIAVFGSWILRRTSCRGWLRRRLRRPVLTMLNSLPVCRLNASYQSQLSKAVSVAASFRR